MNHIKPLAVSRQKGTQRELEGERCGEALAPCLLSSFTVDSTIHRENAADINPEKPLKLQQCDFCRRSGLAMWRSPHSNSRLGVLADLISRTPGWNESRCLGSGHWQLWKAFCPGSEAVQDTLHWYHQIVSTAFRFRCQRWLSAQAEMYHLQLRDIQHVA